MRNFIYRLLLPQSKTVVQMESNGSATTIDPSNDEGPIDVRLFAVCKQVYEEAAHVFLGSNIIKIDLEGLFLPPLLREESQANLTPKLRRITIRLPLYQAESDHDHEYDSPIQKVQSIRQALVTRSRLTEIYIMPCMPKYWCWPDINEAVNRVAECFSILRGLGGQIFLLEGDVESEVFLVLKGQSNMLTIL